MLQRVWSLALGLLALGFVAGCQNMGGGSSPRAAEGSGRAVLVNGGHGTFIYYQPAGSTEVKMLSSEGAQQNCPQCEKDAAGFFKTGHVDPVCSACGAHRTVLNSPH